MTRGGEKRLLVTGMSGFLGYALGRIAPGTGLGFVLTATCYRRRPEGFRGDLVPVDLADRSALEKVLVAVRPQAVIHLAAISQPNRCESDGAGTAAVNVAAGATLARWCARHQARLVFTSSDLVFDGSRPPYGEDAVPTPLNAYARQKVGAERAIGELHPRAVICRMPLLFGYGGPGAQGFAQEMVTAIARGTPLNLFTDEFRTPLWTTCAARALLAALDWPGGIYHLGGPERISRHAFGQRIAAQLGVGEAHLQPLTQGALPMAAERPADVSLTNRKARALGFAPLALDDAIEGMLSDFGLKGC